MLVISTTCFAENINDIYIKINGNVYPFQEVIARSNGAITPMEGKHKYLIEINEKKLIIDFSSGKQVRATLGFLYPSKPIIELSFINVKPNTIAYFDGEQLVKIDKSGNSESHKFQVDTQGKHIILLKKKTKIVNNSNVDIKSSSLINCSGRDNMVCKVISD